ncbi:MAG: hypothetical protein GYA87_08570, partial [Christensenellaceae bacterium]|nr:hypothetical protein [Christensenellaceae bacterium]
EFNEDTNIKGYKNIIYGAGLYANNLNGIKDFAQKAKETQANIIVFACGFAPIETGKLINDFVLQGIKKSTEISFINRTKFFQYRSAMFYSKLKTGHKIIMWIINKIVALSKIGKGGQAVKEAFGAYGIDVNYAKKDDINTLVDYVKGLF